MFVVAQNIFYLLPRILHCSLCSICALRSTWGYRMEHTCYRDWVPCLLFLSISFPTVKSMFCYLIHTDYDDRTLPQLKYPKAQQNLLVESAPSPPYVLRSPDTSRRKGYQYHNHDISPITCPQEVRNLARYL